MKVTTVYLWLDGCAVAVLNEESLAAILLDAVRAGNFELLYSHCSTHHDRIVALAVVGESHVVLHAVPAAGTVCAEVLSCTTREAAAAAIDVVRARIPHESASDEWVSYEVDKGFA